MGSDKISDDNSDGVVEVLLPLDAEKWKTRDHIVSNT